MGFGRQFLSFQVYAPTSTYDKQTTRAFYDHLQQTINNIPQEDDLFVMGDFNSKVGGLRCSFPEVIGEFSNTQRGFNTRGESLSVKKLLWVITRDSYFWNIDCFFFKIRLKIRKFNRKIPHPWKFIPAKFDFGKCYSWKSIPRKFVPIMSVFKLNSKFKLEFEL